LLSFAAAYERWVFDFDEDATATSTPFREVPTARYSLMRAGTDARFAIGSLALLGQELVAGLIAPRVVLPEALLGLTFVLDLPGAMLLGTAALLWIAAGAYARAYLRGTPNGGRFAVWWLMTLTGNLGVFMAADMVGFYLFFTLVSLAAYGLVVHDGTPAARRAGAVYIGLAAVVNVGILPGLAAFKQFRNAQVAYVMIGIGGAYLMRRWWLFGSLLVLEAVNFAAYPSATSILCRMDGTKRRRACRRKSSATIF
jgi:formate hydrogenlyase subunit 3/multisubunit Na+/H+ antiporter MnhD subunit